MNAGLEELLGSSEPPEGRTQKLLEIIEVPRHAICGSPLAMAPDKLGRVEFRSIAREPEHLKRGVPFQESGHQFPAVLLTGVPEEG